MENFLAVFFTVMITDFVAEFGDKTQLRGVSVCLTQFYLSVKRAFNGVLSEAFRMRASNTPFSDFHALDVSS